MVREDTNHGGKFVNSNHGGRSMPTSFYHAAFDKLRLTLFSKCGI
jgi:hypothetical protein